MMARTTEDEEEMLILPAALARALPVSILPVVPVWAALATGSRSEPVEAVVGLRTNKIGEYESTLKALQRDPRCGRRRAG